MYTDIFRHVQVNRGDEELRERALMLLSCFHLRVFPEAGTDGDVEHAGEILLGQCRAFDVGHGADLLRHHRTFGRVDGRRLSSLDRKELVEEDERRVY